MARGPPSARERAVTGVTWALRGLVGFLAVCLGTLVALIACVPLYNLPSPSLYQTGQLEDALGLLSILFLALGAASGLLYGIGLAGLYGPRKELGPVHATSVSEIVPWLVVALVLFAVGAFVPSLTGPLLAFPGIGYAPPTWAWGTSVVIAGLRATFSGLVLYYAVQGLAQEDARVRLLLGMALGVLGAIVWSGLSAYAAGVGGPSVASLLPFLAGVVAGLGTSAISLLLFIAVYREIRQDLRAGRIPAS